MNRFPKPNAFFKALAGSTLRYLRAPIFFGRHPARTPQGALIFFPCRMNLLCCGFAGMVAFNRSASDGPLDTEVVARTLERIRTRRLEDCRKNRLDIPACFLGGEDLLDELLKKVRVFKKASLFYEIFNGPTIQKRLAALVEQLGGFIAAEETELAEQTGRLSFREVSAVAARIEILRDVRWCIEREILLNVDRLEELAGAKRRPLPFPALAIFREINAVLNSIDRLEIRGRDSAGLSVMILLARPEFSRFRSRLEKEGLSGELLRRASQQVLVNGGIDIREPDARPDQTAAVTLTYKVAAEIGRLGDNGGFLRRQIREDRILKELAAAVRLQHTVLAHTRWASVGAITQANCHPMDNRLAGNRTPETGCIHVCLNGDIDNFQELKSEHQRSGDRINEEITTDAKIIPIRIEKYLNAGCGLAESFRRAVNDFSGSHAIAMHTDLSPGSIFLAQRGSGQSVYIGLASDGYIPASEAYGFIEETSAYIRVNGEITAADTESRRRGRIYILNQDSAGGLDGIRAMYYDGAPLALSEADIRQTQLTTRDIDRQGFSHYFLKEISESPLSVERTLQGRWQLSGRPNGPSYAVVLDQKTFPAGLQAAFTADRIRRIFFVGQGTAGVAAQVCADLFRTYFGSGAFQISALKSSELSGFGLGEDAASGAMADALVIAVTQSGTTTDTNRAVEMVKERGAHTLAIVNRRDSDITFKADAVMYTSSGRDIEMSVASTKAFYAQIVAGALLGLHIARLKACRSEAFLSAEFKELLGLPERMRRVLAQRAEFEKSAKRLAVAKIYWAAVGSGPNKAAADEIRIKLSELCHKTISSDYIEDKKPIDLSSEPLIIVCAAGCRDAVIDDIIKDTAIFQAHRATPVVIADEGENRFAPYAADVFHVPVVAAHLAPILNTLAGHLWGYYAALAINDGSEFLYDFGEALKKEVDGYAARGADVYEMVLENSFREKIARFYAEFKRRKEAKRFHAALGVEAATDLTLVLKYLSGRLPAADFELDFGCKGTAANMLAVLQERVATAVNHMARPVDAIKHQAKTVTVGTSRLSEKVEGILFDALKPYDFDVSHLTNSNILVLRNLQGVVGRINGAILYRIGGLSLLGELTEQSTIEIVRKDGMLASIASRVETEHNLKGTKRIIVRQGNVYIGKGRSDGRSIIVVPIISASAAKAGMIEYLLLLNIAFKESAPLPVKVKALGGKYEHIKNIVQENSIAWSDEHLDRIELHRLFGFSAEKIAESIVARLNVLTAETESGRHHLAAL